MRIGIFGSVCDPLHREHAELVSAAKQALKLDRIFLIPSKYAAHKDSSKVRPKLRLAMARRALRGKPGWGVLDIEMRNPGKMFVRDHIELLKKKFPRAELFWIIGSDAALAMPWKHKGGFELLDLCTFVVGERKGFPVKDINPRVRKKVIILKKWKGILSSSDIRARIKQGKSVRAFLHPGVLRLILEKKLYA